MSASFNGENWDEKNSAAPSLELKQTLYLRLKDFLYDLLKEFCVLYNVNELLLHLDL